MEFLPILMTASVSTRGMKGACFSDEERYKMYLETLRHYISRFLINSPEGNVKFVFADNSGWDLQTFHDDLTKQFESEIINSNIEFISLPPELFDITKGKGYNELLMINLAVGKSAFIKDAGAFFKVTGRYPIYNLNRFHKAAIKAFDKGYDFFCDVKSHDLYRKLGLNWNSHSFEARLWGSKTDFYVNNIGGKYSECFDYDGRFVECVLYDKLAQMTDRFKHCKESGISVRFSREASFGGVEGSDSSAASFSKNQQSFKSRIKILIGNFFRIFTPWFKF